LLKIRNYNGYITNIIIYSYLEIENLKDIKRKERSGRLKEFLKMDLLRSKKILKAL